MNASPTTGVAVTAHPEGYAIRDVARLAGLRPAQVLAFVRSGAVAPARGPHEELRFGFPDLVLLRTARGLLDTMPARRLHRALRRLRDRLPTDRTLATMHIVAVGHDLAVREGRVSWLPDTGQALLDLEETPAGEPPQPIPTAEALPAECDSRDAVGWFQLGCDQEAQAPARAIEAYRRALRADPEHVDARLNLGRLLHEAGVLAEAETLYREALERRPGDGTAAYNLGVVLEDLGRPTAAVSAYERALSIDPDCADAHYNLGHLAERLGDPRRALRHLQAFRRLQGEAPE